MDRVDIKWNEPWTPDTHMQWKRGPIAPKVVLSTDQYIRIVNSSLALIVTYLEGMHKDSSCLVYTAYQEPAPILHSATQVLQGPVQH